MKLSSRLLFVLSGLLLADAPSVSAQTNIYWRSAPGTAAWGTANNWANTSGGTSGGSVPNSATVIANFGTSSKTSLTLGGSYTVHSMSFAGGAPAYTFTLGNSRSLILKNGIVNSSSNAPTFAVAQGTLSFDGGSAANALINVTQAGTVNFDSTATAGTSTISLTDEDSSLIFSSGSSAGSASITAGEYTDITLNNTSTLGTATLSLHGSSLRFNDSATAGSATITADNNAYIALNGSATLGNATISLDSSDIYAVGTSSAGTSVITSSHNYLTFTENSSLGSATLHLNSGSSLTLQDNATAGNATLSLVSARVTFSGNATGGNAALVLDADSSADFEYATNADLGIGSLAGAGTVYLAGNTLDIGSNNTDTVFSGVIRPAQNLLSPTGAGINKVGTGNLTLSGNNSYTGDTTISGGTLTLGSATATGASNVMLNGGILGFGTATSASIGGLGGSGGLVLANTNSAAVTLSVGSNNRSTTYAGNLSGAGGLTKTGTGALTLSGANTQSGATTISSGALRFANAGAVSANSNIRFDGGVIDLVSGGPSDFTTGTGGGQVKWLTSGGFGASGGARTVTINGGGVLVWGANNFMTGSGALVLGSATSDGTITFANAIDLGSSARTIRVDHGTAALDAVLSGALTGSGGLIKSGTGSLALSNASYTGATRLDGGSLRLDSSSQAPVGSNFIFNGGVLELGDGAPTNFTIGTGAGQVSWMNFGGGGGFAAFGADRTVTLNGGANLSWSTAFSGINTPLTLGSASSDATLTLTNNIDYGNTPFFQYVDVNDGSAAIDARLSGVISGTGVLAKRGAGNLALTGTNTYTGATWLMGGSLEFSSLASLGSAPSIIFYGGTLRFAAGNTTDVSAYLQNNYAPGQIDTNGNNVTFATALGGYYLKSGAGTLTLTAANTTFTSLGVNGGTLELRGSGTTGDNSDYYSKVEVARDSDTTGALVVGGTGVTWSMPNLYIGNGAGSAGSMTVTDSASVNSLGGYGTSVGTNGTGSLSVLNGGSFSTNYLTIGDRGAGTMLVDNGTVTTSSFLVIGGRSSGTLTVQNGGTFTNNSIYGGAELGSNGGSGTVNVTGAGSQFTIDGSIRVGNRSAGTLNISNGGSVSTTEATVGYDSRAVGNVTITGAGSVWNINTSSRALELEYRSNSTVTLANGGTINFTGANKEILIGTTSTFNLGGGGAAADLNATIINAGTFIVDNTNTVTLSELFTGNDVASTFTKTGSGTAILAKGINGNTVNINGGTLQIGDGTSVGDLGYDYSFSNGGILVLNTSYGSASLGTLGGAGSLTLKGGGTLTLSNTNSYSGTTTVSAGTLKVSHASALGTTAGGTVVSTSGALNISGVSIGAEALSLAGSGVGGTGALLGTGTSSLSGAITLADDVSIGGTGNTLTLSGAIGESGGVRALTKVGTGTLVLSAANTYSGATTVSAGTLSVTQADGLGTTAAGTSVSSGAALNINGVAVGAEAVSITGTGISSAGALTGTGTASLSGAITLFGNSSIGGTGNTFTLSGIIGESGGARTLTKAGSGTLILSGANTYSGATTVSAGTLSVSHADALGTTVAGTTVSSGAALNINGVSIGAEALTISGTGISSAGALTGTGTSSLSGAVTLAANSSIGGTGNTLTLSGIIGESGGTRTLTKVGTGTLILSGANTYGGTTTVSAGTLRATTSASSLGSGTLALSGGSLELASDTGLAFNRNTTVSNNTTVTSDILAANGAGVTHTLGMLSIGAQTLTLAKGSNVGTGTAGLTFGNVTLTATGATFTASLGTRLTLSAVAPSSGNRSFTVNGAGDTAITGNITTGSGTLTKDGVGTLTLSGVNTYTGATSVNAGKLFVNGSLANTAVTVKLGATLGGTGTLSGATTIQSGGHLAPGTPTGTTTFKGGLNLNSGAILDFELGSSNGKIVVFTGTTLTGPSSGKITVNLFDSGGFTAGTYTLIDATGATLTSIGATSFDLGIVIAGYDFSFTQTGNLIELTASAVPEPATFAALAGMFVLIATAARRRRRD